jgi:uncharacterized protein
VILLDTSGLLAALDRSQRLHAEARRALMAARGPLLLSPFVLAELDYLLATKVGMGAELAFLEEVERGAYQLETFGEEDIAVARGIIERHADLEIGLADASIVVLSARRDVADVLTLDERHFRALRRPGGGAFRILPADA